ncbi:MAG: cation-transporting P-type ATPase [Prochlorococcaceae cyanobacterium]
MGEERILDLLDTRFDTGLHPREAQARLVKDGPNALSLKEGKNRLTIFLEQFNQPLVFILMAAGAMTGLLRKWADMGVIFAVYELEHSDPANSLICRSRRYTAFRLGFFSNRWCSSASLWWWWSSCSSPTPR